MTNEGDGGDGAKTIIRHLESSGFFKQIDDLETNLKAVAEDLQAIGQTATRRLEETESLAAHVLAVEAILSVMLNTNPVDADAVKEVVKANTKALTGSEDGSTTVQLVADSILSAAAAAAAAAAD